METFALLMPVCCEIEVTSAIFTNIQSEWKVKETVFFFWKSMLTLDSKKETYDTEQEFKVDFIYTQYLGLKCIPQSFKMVLDDV